MFNIEKVSRTLEDSEIKKAITAQLKLKYIIESNTKIVKDMSEGKFNNKEYNDHW